MISWWDLNLSLEAFLSEVSGESQSKYIKNSFLSWRVNMNNIFNYDGYSLQLSGFYEPGSNIYQEYIYPMYRIDLGINKKLLDNKLTLGFRVRDLLNQFAFSVDASRENFWSKNDIRWSSREFYVSVRYSFGNLKTKKRRDKDLMPLGES